MMIRDVLQLGNPALRLAAEPVVEPGSAEVAALLADLSDTLAHWRTTTGYGRGIAAPQIGVLRRVVFMNIDQQTPWPLINPEIVARSDETVVVWDACLSFLGIFCQVTRHRAVTVRYQDTAGAWQEIAAEGDLAELLQHEIDHLDGILAIDRITDLRTLCTREEFERRYRRETVYGQGRSGNHQFLAVNIAVHHMELTRDFPLIVVYALNFALCIILLGWYAWHIDRNASLDRYEKKHGLRFFWYVHTWSPSSRNVERPVGPNPSLRQPQSSHPMPSLSASKRCGSGGRTGKFFCGMSAQSRSGEPGRQSVG